MENPLYFVMSIYYNNDIPGCDKDFVIQEIMKNDKITYQGNEEFLSEDEDALINALRKLYLTFSHIKDIATEIVIYSVIDIKTVNFEAVFDKSRLN
jgi:hypothetical protein